MNFVKYRVFWTDNSIEFESFLWLPDGEQPEKYISDILNQLGHLADNYDVRYEVVEG